MIMIASQATLDGHSPSAGMAISAAMIGPRATKAAACDAPKRRMARPYRARDLVDEARGTAEQVTVFGRERHQSPVDGKDAEGVDRRQPSFRGECDDLGALGGT